MKLLINFLKITGIYTYSIIGLAFLPRPVYVSSQIQQEQIYYIEKSIEKMNLYRTYDKNENHIRIQYDNDIIANTAMSGSVYSFGSFSLKIQQSVSILIYTKMCLVVLYFTSLGMLWGWGIIQMLVVL